MKNYIGLTVAAFLAINGFDCSVFAQDSIKTASLELRDMISKSKSKLDRIGKVEDTTGRSDQDALLPVTNPDRKKLLAACLQPLTLDFSIDLNVDSDSAERLNPVKVGNTEININKRAQDAIDAINKFRSESQDGNLATMYHGQGGEEENDLRIDMENLILTGVWVPGHDAFNLIKMYHLPLNESGKITRIHALPTSDPHVVMFLGFVEGYEEPYRLTVGPACYHLVNATK